MIDSLFAAGWDRHGGETRDVWLILGASWRDRLPYREAFRERAAATEHFHYVPTLSREPYLTEWDGETAYVQYVLATYLADDAVRDGSLPEAFVRARDARPAPLVDARLDPSRMEVYGCGLNAMVESVAAAAEALGVPPEHAQFEGYG